MMGTIRVHEFTSLDGVIDNPTWTFDFGFVPAMGQDIGNLMSSCDAMPPPPSPTARQPNGHWHAASPTTTACSTSCTTPLIRNGETRQRGQP
jgi:hypothetical protein